MPGADFIFGDLFAVLTGEVATAAGTVADIESSLGQGGVEPPPLAVQGNAPASGLFSFDKFSSMPVLVEAVREAAAASGLDDSKRRLFLVPLAHVIKLHTSGGVVQTLEVDVAGERKFLAIGPHCAVILAASSTIESTRIALHSFPTPLMGRNLMAHVRSDFTVQDQAVGIARRPGPCPDGGPPRSRHHTERALSPAGDRLHPYRRL